MSASAFVFSLLAASCSEADRDPPRDPLPPVSGSGSTTATATPTEAFGLYILALTWAPSFCCTHGDKEECGDLAHAFAGSHLTLHGLWPNYTDAETRARVTYPDFCGAYAHCRTKHDASCEPDLATLPDDMRELGPGYIGDHHFLARHEWAKHGSCTGLDPAAYFRAALDAMKQLPGTGTPDPLRAAIGHDLTPDELQHAFGVPAASILLGCEAHCRLSQVGVCLAHDARGIPTKPTPCPATAIRATYDNGCITRGCERIAIPEPGSCTVRDSNDDRPQRRKSDPVGPGGHACNRPGQGPSCTTNDQCTRSGYLRCARSGCCTSQP